MSERDAPPECFAIRRVLAVTAAAYPNFELTKETVQIYARLLEDIPIEALELACLDHISRSKFFPTIAELRDAYARVLRMERALPTAFEAWSEVTKQILEVGSYGVPEFSNPLIKDAVDGVGGWRYLCRSTNQSADRARFLQAYETYVQRFEDEVLTPPQIKALAAELVHDRSLPAPGWPKATEADTADSDKSKES